MPVHLAPVHQYEKQLQEKTERFETLMSTFTDRTVETFESPANHYRMRAEFKMWHQDNKVHYAMYEPGQYKKAVTIDRYEIGSTFINKLMPELLVQINQSETLKHRLFQAEFLTSTTGDAVITLIYHKQLDDDWHTQAEALAQHLSVSIIGRSRKQKRIIGKDFVTEVMTVAGKQYSYQQVEASFTQPNAAVCCHMLNWAHTVSEGIGGDLLELYCGNGNFTLPLASQFNRVLATEISKTSVNSAKYNMQANNVNNIAIARMSSEEFSQAMDGEREFRRLADINLKEYEFSTVFVDPPRAGLDDHTTEIVKGFDHIIYVSCNPETLASNLSSICETHEVLNLAMFDQFPYTHHIEAGVMLRRK